MASEVNFLIIIFLKKYMWYTIIISNWNIFKYTMNTETKVVYFYFIIFSSYVHKFDRSLQGKEVFFRERKKLAEHKGVVIFTYKIFKSILLYRTHAIINHS